ncbi:MAG TPA: VWA domain-containing protein [Vicinamibacterales bacterium]|nr:VWA domain-containing protein [Vicinamibacterales bacterium]
MRSRRTPLSHVRRRRGSRSFVTALAGAGVALTVAATVTALAQQQPAPTPQPAAQTQQPPELPRFEQSTGVSIVSVDAVVRDSKGNIVRGLTEKDFQVFEDGKLQKISNFQFRDIDNDPLPETAEINVLDGLEDKLRAEVQRAASTSTPAPQQVEPNLLSADAIANRRLLVLLFDVSSMQPDDIQRAVDSGLDWVDTTMSNADLVALVTIGSRLNVLTDFTSSREELTAALHTLGYTEGTAIDIAAFATAATEEAAASATTDDPSQADSTTETAALEEFNNDVRLRAMKTVCDTLSPIQQKKAVLYFSAGMNRAGDDNQIELRAATNSCNRGNVSIYPVDSRGLQAAVAGGGASQRGRGGQALFNGSGARGISQLSRSQDTLVTLAADTGGRAFTDSNDFSGAFTRVQRDLAAYYLLGYTSTNTAQDGRYRRIQVRLSKEHANLRVESRDGYYANRSFANTNRRDREAQLTDQLNAAVSSTDLPMVVGTGWFRQGPDRFFVPIAMVVPGSSVPVPQSGKVVTLDVRGQVRDEQGRTLSSLKATIELPPPGPDAETLAGRQVMYQSSVVLPPGRFSVKLVARENTGGAVGSFEAPILVPRLREDTMKVSPVVLSTQVQKAADGKSDNPLVRDGLQLVPNLTRAVARNQSMYFYYEVYDPGLTDELPHLRTSMAFYRGKVKVLETPGVERTRIDEPSRKAIVFQLEVPANSFTPGTYECQINLIDAVAQKVSFPRLRFMVQ